MAISPVAVVVARIGLNLFLPASMLMVLFWALGLHRKLGARQARFASVSFALAWIVIIAMTVVGTIADQARNSTLTVISVVLGIVYSILVIAVIIATISELKAMSGYGSAPAYVPVGLFSWAAILPMLALIPLPFAPGKPLAVAVQEAREYRALCKDAGVRLVEKPIAPVRSLAYDSNPEKFPGRPYVERFETDWGGRLIRIGGFGGRADDKKRPAFDFTESRRESGSSRNVGEAPYYRHPDSNLGQPYYGIDTLTADAVLFFEIENPDELAKAYKKRGPVRYRLTLTDRRSGALLGVQTFVVDHANQRACGANLEGNIISQNAFIHDAINR